ncbi:MAG: tryptophan synthase subunit alpha [Armatimonadetes bacterium]|nr:tryptophan synthase subunit alpha [Armatimonadota bacterium]NIM24926.1 tryptophan synthase subunit alpha [Armatimonadota bacterium]NIM68815.1 tryptophan synthase subunit alpha [Armatimonadota bacterium]NIM77062.1 tryptophan synthase subunit alpha [Armatimonadota bacterium]NIN07017.1 tryptophan synthase subunit alpha [Armatimonadota bacterium]
MSRLGKLFTDLKSRSEAALVAFLVGGDPDAGRSFAFLEALVEGGADIIEVGFPFSDPLADGKVIQEGCQRALSTSTTPAQVLEMVKRLRERHEVAVVLFSCFNLLLQYGLEAFAKDATKVGADAVLVTDLPPEEGREWWEIAHKEGLDTIFLVSSTNRPERIREIANLSSGFIYGISRMGVTGARSELPADLPEFMGRLKGLTDLPIAVGFGISTPEHVKQVCAVADGAVVGTALVDLTTRSTPEELKDFVRSLKAATCAADEKGSRAQKRVSSGRK